MNITLHRLMQMGFVGLFCCLAHANQPGQMVTDAELKIEPTPKSKTLDKLKAGQSIEIKERRGGWYATQTDKLTGWVRMLHIRMLSSEKSTSNANLGALTTPRRGDSTVATGIRGLSEEQIKKAKEDTLELRRLDTWVTTEKEALQYAKEAKLNLPHTSNKKGGK